MSIIEKELELLPLGSILEKKLVIPEYQRPYKWKEETILKLLNDIKNNKNKNEYRIGTLILHKEKEEYNIVDGQQRLVSISIIRDILEKINDKKESVANAILDSCFNDISKNNIIKNYQHIKNYIYEEDKDLLKFILDNCKMVVIVVDKLEEAFQLFDSQNSRGKPLEAFDLLKAYHLNEWTKSSSNDDYNNINGIVKKWEKLIDDNKLGELFDVLYRMKKWTIKDNANVKFSKDDIPLFKGINKNKNYPYINSSIVNNYYDINRPIINGEYFFYMLEYYNDLYDIVEGRIKNAPHINYYKSDRTGDILVKSLYKAALIAFINKFGINSLNDNLNIKIYAYAYRIRLEEYRVSYKTINNSINNYFYYIYNFCYEPNDILKLGIMNQKIEVDEKRKIVEIIDYIKNTIPVFL
ncbi:DUF262 domain-containing protein [uncultured Brachyspira sp.]|uniref:DUF262 domain-containing protein n=1 Tax=uncultured Brachyspira sp. TaxID=221953 RepID=UPI0025EAB686|nr:DUF262 domain-containing protein [uncultured Brachyspira sp.]